MKDQVVVSKMNGELAVAIPLYRRHHDQEIGNLEGFSISLTNDKPLAYAIDYDSEKCEIWNAEIVERCCEFLGEL